MRCKEKSDSSLKRNSLQPKDCEVCSLSNTKSRSENQQFDPVYNIRKATHQDSTVKNYSRETEAAGLD